MLKWELMHFRCCQLLWKPKIKWWIVTSGGLVINAGIGAICGWMQDMPAALFAGTSVKNALKYVEVLAEEKALLRMTLPSFIIGGLGGNLW